MSYCYLPTSNQPQLLKQCSSIVNVPGVERSRASLSNIDQIKNEKNEQLIRSSGGARLVGNGHRFSIQDKRMGKAQQYSALRVQTPLCNLGHQDYDVTLDMFCSLFHVSIFKYLNIRLSR